MKDIETLIGYNFDDKSLLQRALTHPSYSHIHGGQNYQRLEFLGDSIVDFVIADEF
ncbi:MAG: ribonuclease III, partial [Clostridia bacterium]|nr:ribonuclease III [Clostridia bacterium]